MPSDTKLDLARAYLSAIGRRGGQSRSPAKLAAIKRNAQLPRKRQGRPAHKVEPDADDHAPINSEETDEITIW